MLENMDGFLAGAAAFVAATGFAGTAAAVAGAGTATVVLHEMRLWVVGSWQ